MKRENQMKRIMLMLVLVALASSGIYFAFTVYRHYGVIARGVSGIALVLLLFFCGKRSGLDVSFEDLLVAPQKKKYLIAAFVAPILFWFAYAQIYEMILFFFK